MWKRVIIAALISLSMYAAWSDRIHLKNGKIITGQVVSENASQVSVKTADGVVAIRRDSIQSIQEDSPEAARRALAATAMSRGDIGKALEEVALDISRPVTVKFLDAQLIAHETALESAARSASREDLIRFSTFLETQPQLSLEAQLSATSYFLAAGMTERAANLLENLPVHWIRSNNDKRIAMADKLLRAIEQELSQSDLDGAVVAYDSLLRLAPERIPAGLSAVVKIKDIRQLAEKGNLEAATDGIVKLAVTDRAAAGHEILRMIELANSQATTETMNLVLGEAEALLDADVFTTGIRAVLHRRAVLLANAGLYDEATSAADRLSLLQPDAGARTQHEVEYIRRRNVIDSDSLAERYQLAVWAREMGLTDIVKEEFRKLQRFPDLQENATLQLRLISLVEQKEKLAYMERVYRAGDYDETIQLAEAFRKEYSDSSLTTKASELAELARYSQWQAARGGVPEAEVMHQNIERYYLQGRYEEALSLANRLLVDYSESSTAKKTEPLREKIIAKMKAQRTGKKPQ